MTGVIIKWRNAPLSKKTKKTNFNEISFEKLILNLFCDEICRIKTPINLYVFKNDLKIKIGKYFFKSRDSDLKRNKKKKISK